MPPASYKAEFIADASGKWASNALRFATAPEAEAYGTDLAGRWTLVREHRVAESTDPVTYRWDTASRQAVPIKED